MKLKSVCFLCALILLGSVNISAQTTKELFSTLGYECLMVSVPSDPVDVPDGNVSLYYEGDTLMCGEDLIKYSTAHTDYVFLKIDDTKVWVVDSCQHERLLMDFGYAVGDSLIYEDEITVVTDVGTTTLSDGKQRRTYRIKNKPNQFPDTHLFIEGIGSEYYGIEHMPLDAPNRTALACVNDHDGLAYVHENINPVICELFTRTLSAVDDNAFSDISIYPNPSQGIVQISNPTGRSMTLSLISLIGQEFHSQEVIDMEAEIDLSHMPQGQYFVILKDKDAVVYTDRLILMD